MHVIPNDAFYVGNNLLAATIVAAWSNPQVTTTINDFVESLEQEEENNDTNTMEDMD